MSPDVAIERYAVEQVCQDPGAVRPSFQSVLDLERGRVWGYELLASIGGAVEVPTAAWFVAAAEYGLEGALEARIVRTGLSVIEELPEGQLISINVTPRALRSAQLQHTFGGQGRFDSAVLEISEPHVGEEGLATSLEGFRAAGGKIAVDSLGAGSTRLRSVIELQPDVLKLDRSLVAGIDADPAKAAAAGLFAELARRVGATAIAVGVERKEEVEAVKAAGIGLAQGFLLGRRHGSIAEARERVRPVE